MIILAIQFIGLLVICYVFFVYATRRQIVEDKGRRFPVKAVGIIVLTLLAFIVFASWYVQLGLSS